ncbi:MAG TPA: isoleucine--tRNA ligase [Candidatus Binataceae bacterium]|nr:isoleucine--tRNA ligase [Candidatus Binataceae bacterium]
MAENDYKATLKLPKTEFPMKANLPKREPEMLARWNAAELYAQILAARADSPTWILHDGPPYANGRVHLGTALNKILKDFVVRSRSMMGFRTPFVPGWDCHGMPIEFKVSRDLGSKARTLSKLELRRLCKAEAEKWIDLQRKDFMRLGCVGDWFKPYITMDPAYDAAEIGVLRNLVAGGYVYRGLRPVHWCFADRTALAEAEVEYRDHVSPSIYVAFTLNSAVPDAGALAADPAEGAELAGAHHAGKLAAVIWTTTPWTLPANLGISLNASFDYVALKVGDGYYIVAERLADAVAKECSLAVDKRIALDRDALKALDGRDIFRHPFIARDGKLMFADHVTADAGTGLVHTAPGHGYEDFVVGAQYGLKPYTPVDTGGVFTADGGEWAGQNVFKANDSIVDKLREIGALLHTEKFSHSYPHCWRCKNPLIFLAADQWFMKIDHERLRARIVAEIDGVEWIPGWSRDRIRNMTETRPDWCISRQRAWGVPIPALRCKACGYVGLYDEVMRAAEKIFTSEGSDAWFIRAAGDFRSDGLKCAECGAGEFDKEEDVLDVWFDSGSSQAAVLGQRPELAWPADAYLEAVEQARGWFGSSLACAVAERGHAPFRSVISHGLTVDEQGRKMSKSLGNSEDAADAVERIGADVLRLVYASLDYTTEIALGNTIYTAVGESYRKIRNTCRFMLGNLSDFDPARDAIEPAAMLEFDRYIMARTERLKAEVLGAYEAFDYQRAYHALLNFIVVDLSSLYIDVARDRLYCDAANSRERRSAQTALQLMLEALLRMLAPLIPFTADEVYAHVPGKTAASVHLLTLQAPDARFADDELEARWQRLLQVRGEAMKLLEAMRQAGAIGAPLEARLELAPAAATSSELKVMLRDYREQLKDLFIVSDVALLADAEAASYTGVANGSEDFHADGYFGHVAAHPPLVMIGRKAAGRKCQRCWKYFDDGDASDLDERCRAVVHP